MKDIVFHFFASLLYIQCAKTLERLFCSERNLSGPSQSLKKIMFWYNVFQILFNCGLFFSALFLLRTYDWHLTINLLLPWHNPNIWLLNMSHPSLSGSHLFKWYMWSRYVDWCDTVFLIMQRKSLRFLHIFHHAFVPVTVSVGIALGAGLPSGLYCIVLWNTLVHIFMYTYYLVSTSTSSLLRRLSVFFKPWITSFQMFQFVMMCLQSLLGICFRSKDEETPNGVFLTQFGFASVMLYLFAQWAKVHYFTKKHKYTI